jgi:methylenetetrahydrofolate reductase (NADPH)
MTRTAFCHLLISVQVLLLAYIVASYLLSAFTDSSPLSGTAVSMLDERLPALIASVPPDQAYFSLEFFPPKTQAGFNNLQSRLSRMATALKPLYVTVTWGAGGSTSAKSLELAEVTQRQLGLPTVLHLTCTNMRRSMVDEALEACKELGIRNILALRGDPPREEYREESPPRNGSSSPKPDEFVWAIDLVRYIRKKHGDYFAIGVAGYPEGHADESHPEAGKQSVEHDLPYLVDKVTAGADFIMTQLTYDINAYTSYEKRLRTYKTEDGKAPFTRIPIIPGLMPIQSYQIVKRITKLSHAKIPTDIADRIEKVKDDDNAVKRVGVDIMSELVEQIRALPQPEGLPRGLHFYTLNLEKSVAFILERCHLLPHLNEASPDEGSDSDVVQDNDYVLVGNEQATHSQPRISRRRASSVNAQPHNRVILDSSSRSGTSQDSAQSERSNGVTHQTPEQGAGIPAADPTRKHSLLISEGQGSLGREATWDDFPNGRWGPAHSPAYGEIDGYGPSLKVGPATARKLWGSPTSPQDVTSMFSRLITGDLASIPWSDEVDPTAGLHGPGSLRAETSVIREQILELIQRKKYWTLASQPAVDGARSNDEVFGWGPRDEGFVFQKAFVEFFCSRAEWENVLRQKLVDTPKDHLSWMKTDADGVYESSDNITNDGPKPARSSKRTPGQSGVNAVTWGVFRGKEIVTPTIIESESFRAWGEEAFAIWAEWRRCYARGSSEEQTLESLRKDLVLVNVVGQDYVGGHEGNGRELWDVLLA